MLDLKIANTIPENSEKASFKKFKSISYLFF